MDGKIVNLRPTVLKCIVIRRNEKGKSVMKKRVVTFLLALTVAFGSMAPSTDAFAAESPIVDECVELVGCAEDDADVDASVEASTEAASEASTQEQEEISEETQETETPASEESKEESREETKEDPSADAATEELSAAVVDAEDADNANDAAEENSAEDASTEASSEEEAATKASDESAEAASEASSEEEEKAPELDEEEAELLGAKTQFKDGYYDTKLGCAYKDGKIVTGWIAVDKATKQIMETGSKAAAYTDCDTYYIDPVSRKAVKGVYSIGGKKYLFDSSCRLQRGSNILSYVTYDGDRYLVSTTGQLRTGWVKLTATEKTYISSMYSSMAPIRNALLNHGVYADPSTGVVADKAWAPLGKGWTFVHDGITVTDEDKEFGTYTKISDHSVNNDGRVFDYYCFKNDVMLTGFVYFDKNGNYTTAAKAAYSKYCDPVTGAITSGMITANGKSYIAQTLDVRQVNPELKSEEQEGFILPNTFVTYNNYTYYAQKDGSLAVSKLFKDGEDYYYAQKDGKLARNCKVIINGKACAFDKDGKLIDFSKPENESRAVAYVLKENALGFTEVYAKKKGSKATDGYSYYYDKAGKEKAKSIWFSFSVNRSDMKYYLDKNGNFAKGIVAIGDKKYYFDPSTGVVGSHSNTYGKVITYSGKPYLINQDGSVETRPGFYDYYSGAYVCVKDASGQLAKGLVTIKGKRYLFKSDYTLNIETEASVNGKVYMVNPLARSGSAPEEYYILSKKEIDQILGKSIFMKFNSDGSGYNGWVTINKKKYYYYYGYLMAYMLGGGLEERGVMVNPENVMVIIGGKRYFFSHEGYAMSGEHVVKKGDYFTAMTDSLDFRNDPAPRDMEFYLDPKSCAAVTGFKKLGGKTYYYSEADTDYALKGEKVKNTTINIKGKYYSFDAEGAVITSNSEGDVLRKADGSYTTGKVKEMYYSPRTGKIEKNVLRKTGNKWYYYGSFSNEERYLATRNMDGKKITAVFNNDGSINGFVDDSGNRQVNTIIGEAKTGYYFLGANGLPATGMVVLPADVSVDLTGAPGARLFVESDGFTEYDKDSTSTEYKMVKSGNKIYVVKNALTVFDTIEGYQVSDYSSLPQADRTKLDYYSMLYNRTCYVINDYSGATEGRALPVYVNNDGSVKSNTTLVTNERFLGTLHFNKYGIPKESYGLLVKAGSGWYLSNIHDVASAGSHQWTLYGDGDSVRATLSWDNNKKLKPIVDSKTGKPLNGLYKLNTFPALPDGTGLVLKNVKVKPYYYFKNGYPVGGVHTGTLSRYNMDADTGWCLDGDSFVLGN